MPRGLKSTCTDIPYFEPLHVGLEDQKAFPPHNGSYTPNELGGEYPVDLPHWHYPSLEVIASAHLPRLLWSKHEKDDSPTFADQLGTLTWGIRGFQDTNLGSILGLKADLVNNLW